MTRLERTAIGSFTLSDAVDLETLTRENWRRLRLPLSLGVSSLPRVALSEAEWQDFRHGRAIVRELDPAAIEGEVAAFDDSGRLLGIASATKDPQGRLILRVVKGGFRADDSFG
jgi:tRNA U55 pseudouridine synthase TruB